MAYIEDSFDSLLIKAKKKEIKQPIKRSNTPGDSKTVPLQTIIIEQMNSILELWRTLEGVPLKKLSARVSIIKLVVNIITKLCTTLKDIDGKNSINIPNFITSIYEPSSVECQIYLFAQSLKTIEINIKESLVEAITATFEFKDDHVLLEATNLSSLILHQITNVYCKIEIYTPSKALKENVSSLMMLILSLADHTSIIQSKVIIDFILK